MNGMERIARYALSGIFSSIFTFSIVYASGPTNDWDLIIQQQKASQPAFRKKAEALVAEMTLDEKISLYSMSAKKIDRLGIPAHDWWNEAVHGVGRNGKATQFPVSISMASTWDPTLILRMSDAIGKEARGIYHSRENPTGRYEGLTLWSPTMNLARDPRWGRNDETYGEDPLLTAELATAFIKGLQGTDPNYYQTIACAKHFIANNSEYNRLGSSPAISERDLREHYMPAFRAAVEKANVQQVMTAYNGINGVPCMVNRWLLRDVLRNEWGFSGTVVTDVGGPVALKRDHKYVANDVEGIAAILNSGVDVLSDLNKDYVVLNAPKAIKKGLVSEKTLDRAIAQNLTTRMQLGQVMNDPGNPYTKIPASVVGSEEHLAIAREIAQKGTVLLKNDSVDGMPVLPLQPGKIKKIIVAGPYANVAQLGDYSGTPTHSGVTPLEGLRAGVTKDVMVQTRTSYGRNGAPIPTYNLKPPEGVDIGHGMKAEYFKGGKLRGKAKLVRVDPDINFGWGVMPLDKVDPLIPRPHFSVRWTGTLVPDITGEYRLFTQSEGGIRVWLDDRSIIDQRSTGGNGESVPVQLKAGKSYPLRVEYLGHGWCPSAYLRWIPPMEEEREFFKPGIAEDSDSTLVVYVAGFNLDMVSEFKDFQDLSLPEDQRKDIERWLKRYKRVAVVLNGGNPVADEWLFESAPAVLETWYPGQEGGAALADLILGKISPSGKLPQTWYRSADDLPAFDDYSIHTGRTYMYNEKPVLFPFGYGISYTTFEYGPVDISAKQVKADGTLTVKIPVRNTGSMVADEIVQVYAKNLESHVYQPKKKLIGFGRVTVEPGAEEILQLDLPVKRLAHWNEQQDLFVVEPGDFELQIGASSKDIRQTKIITVIK